MILTTSLTNQLAPGLIRNEIDERIAKIRPSSTPLDQISRMVGARKAASMRVDYYSVNTKEGRSQTSRPMRSLTISAGTPFTLPVKDGAIFSETETVLIPKVTIPQGNNKDQALVGYIASVDGNDLSVVPVNLDESLTELTISSLNEGAEVIRMGRAARELDVQTAQYVALPKKDYNYCQIFKSQVEESLYQRLADKEVGWNFTDQEEVAVMDMRLGMEKSFLFGSRARIKVGATDDEILFTGGIWNQTTRSFKLRPLDQFSASELIELSRAAFSGRSGSTRKVLLGGSGLIESISKAYADSPTLYSEKKNVWGIDFYLVTTKFGSLYVHHSEVFDLCGKENCGMVIDPDYITKYVHVPFTADRISFRKQGVRNTEGVVLTEASCIVLRHPDSHLRIEAPEAEKEA